MVKLPRIRTPALGWPGVPLLSSIRGRIIAGFTLLVLILAAVVAGSAWLAQQHRSDLAEMERNATTFSLLQDAKAEGTSAIASLQFYITSGDERAVPGIRSSLATAIADLEQARAMEEMEGDEALAAQLDDLVAAAASISEAAEQAIERRQDGDALAAGETLAGALPQMERIEPEFEAAAEAERQDVANLRARADRTGDLAFWLLVISGSIGAVLGLAASAFIARSILKSLSSLESAALAVAGGDLEARAPATGPRELARLGASLNRMTESLLDASKRRQLEAERERAYASLREELAERKRAQEALRKSEERSRLTVETAQDAFISMHAGGVITAWNSAAQTIFGWSREEALGRSLGDTIIPPQLREAHERGLKHFLATGEGPLLNKRTETMALHRDGHEFPVELAVWAVGSGDACIFSAFVHDITRRKRAEEALRRLNQELEREQREIEALNRSLEAKVKQRTRQLRLANEELQRRNRQLLDARAQAATDSLTGVSNHRAFQERVREEVRRAQETGSPVGLIMLDIDDFKRVNDSLGHLEGDSILRQLALVLADAARRDDVYRYGGDEFALLLPGGDRRTTARTAERLRRAVARRMHGNPTAVTVSLGAASFPEAAASAEELVYGADAAMYWAKSAGKDRVGDWSKLVGRRADGTLPWYAADRGVKAPDVVAALVAALAAKDPVTSAHTERCSWYAAKLAQELGLGKEDRLIVGMAALLHDIGKLAVPDEVLFKPGPLNEEEWAQMKEHPAAALHVLGQIRPVADAAPAILHHHEHFDGSGYPDGLAGEEIPIASRILLVSDAFDAMTTDRPYRKAMPVEVAIDELKRNSGSQFDPAVVAAFLRVLSHVGAQPLCRMARDQVGPGPAATPSSRRTGR